ncbi:HNH endonuclease signature motif containing protein [Nesterenkonia jeotgali]|uniref:HNH nuclease domain-containing protein n=1 Tax=Nesterenkonia jeotgali TaxID=317018 RepID=A0A839FP54_9MICC|nr:HNH endonuclease signature motif containing protein [Nesterenkonia jeotgali]MBA8921716.1 hypothetical protein [Nesterenkonia jeotgali]
MQVALTDPNAEPLRESQRQLNRGQAEQLRLLVDYVESFMRDTEVIEPEFMSRARGRATAESAAIMNAAEAMGASEGHVYTQYHQACFARRHLPQVWGAVRAGDVPVRSLVRVVSAAERLVSPKHRERLDAEAAAYALTHRPARLTAWLNRFVARAEPAQHEQRCRRGHAERRVWLEHLEDGVSILHAMLPTLTAEAIKNRLVDVARSPKQNVPYDPCVERPAAGRSASSQGGPGSCHPGTVQGGFDWLGLPSEGPDAGLHHGSELALLPSEEGVAASGDGGRLEHAAPPMSREAGDPRTQAQREADLLSSWLLTGETASGAPINGHVGILIEPETLLMSYAVTGVTPGAGKPALSRNRRHAYPAEMIRRIILSEEHRITWTPVPRGATSSAPQNAVAAASGAPAGAVAATTGDPQDAAFQSQSPPLPEPPQLPEPEPPPLPEPEPPPRPGPPPQLEPLARVYEGRFVPKLLRRAIEFRDGTCQAPGCMVAAEHCDIDHQIPWPHGATTASNLWALCRKHHRLKTAGFLDIPTDRPPPASP